jgi:hypothetical protein
LPSATDEPDAELINFIKELQKTDPVGKEQWIAFCDQQCGGKRDPAKHSAEDLRRFISGYHSGQRLQTEEDSVALAAVTKLMQKKSDSFKVAWSNYCHAVGGGINDPAKHEPAFHAQFLDHVCRVAVGGYSPNLGSSPLFASRGKRRGPMGMGGRESQKEQLVNMIKSYQRQGQEEKELWWNYCDKELGGVRDPSRHDTKILQQFASAYGVPDLGTGLGSAYVPGSDAIKDTLIQRIKAYQKGGDEHKETWYKFCGVNRDPSRHDAHKLQEFVTTYNVP